MESLILGLKNKKEKAYNECYKKYYTFIFLTVNCMVKNEDVAEDLTSEIFIKIFNKIDTYVEDTSFKYWIKKISYNHTIDWLRSQKKTNANIYLEDDNVYTQLKDFSKSPEEEMIQMENHKELNRVVNEKLPILLKNIILYRYYKNMSYEEIANELQMPIGTVKAYLHKAKQKIYKNLKT